MPYQTVKIENICHGPHVVEYSPENPPRTKASSTPLTATTVRIATAAGAEACRLLGVPWSLPGFVKSSFSVCM